MDNQLSQLLQPSQIRPVSGVVFRHPDALRLHPTLTMVEAPKDETFYYRGEHKRVIRHGWTDEHRLNSVDGPIVYVVTDHAGAVRYVGRHLAETPLRARWFRHGTIHHQAASRKQYLAELDASRGPLTVWSAAARELRDVLPRAAHSLTERDLATGLEALWVARWRDQLWNTQRPKLVPGFDDGSYWANA